MSQKIIGIDLGGTSIKFAILTTAEKSKENGQSRPTFWDYGVISLMMAIESIQHRFDLLWIGSSGSRIEMGSTGVVDRDKGTVIGAYNPNLENPSTNQNKRLKKLWACPFFIDNDAQRSSSRKALDGCWR